MSPHEDDDLQELNQLAHAEAPPPDLEDRVVAALHERSLVNTRGNRGATATGKHWQVAAAVLLAAVGGWIARGFAATDASPVERGREYLVLFAEPHPLVTSKSTEELVVEYRDWGLGLAERGHLVTGRRLLSEGVRLSTRRDGSVSERPEGSLAEATGFFLIRAESQRDAIDLVSDTPHLDYGGEISLREVARDG